MCFYIYCQHAASRVESLPIYVQRANDYRAITGEGFTFLNIPRTYYGLLDTDYLINNAKISETEANKVMSDLVSAGLCDEVGTVDLAVYDGEGRTKLEQAVGGNPAVVEVVVRSLYRNMHSLLKDSITQDMYIT